MAKTYSKTYEITATMHKLGTVCESETRTFRLRANSRKQALNHFEHAYGSAAKDVQCKLVENDIEFTPWSGFQSGKVMDITAR